MLSAFRSQHPPYLPSPAEKDRVSHAAAAVALIALLAHWGVIIAFVAPRWGTLSLLRLHYTASRGVDWVDIWYVIFVFPAFATLTYLVNLLFGRVLARRNRTLGRIVWMATAFLEIIMTVGGTLAVLLNG